MAEETAVEARARVITREAFLARFSRISSGLDPDQVYGLFQKVMERVEQVEEQARRASAPFVLEATLREATAICVRATEASEQAHAEIIAAARDEAERLKAEAKEWSDEVRRSAAQEAEGGLAEARRRADALIAEATSMSAEIRQEAASIIREAQEALDQARRLAAEAEAEAAAREAPSGPIPISAGREPQPGRPDAPQRPTDEPDKVMGRFTLPSWLDL